MVESLVLGLPEEISFLKSRGEIEVLHQLIKDWLRRDIPHLLRRRLELELIRLERIGMVYPYSFNKALEIAKEKIRNFTEEEFAHYIDIGTIDYVIINGERFFESRFVENLGFLLPEIKERMVKDEVLEKVNSLLNERMKALIDGDRPKTYLIKSRILFRVNSPFGRKVRVWLPFPKESYFQSDVTLIKTSHSEYSLASPGSRQRTIYMEGIDTEEFFVEFSYITKEVFNPELFEKVMNMSWNMEGSLDMDDSLISEKPPHIVFNYSLRALAKELTANCFSIIEKAYNIYDFVTTAVKYSYVKPYLYYDNIPQFVLENLRGDCGFQALLFISLCRIAGIPVHWQSGWYANPFLASPHDWAVLYLPDFGPVPVDLSFGGKEKLNQERRAFYFGNLDGFRMIANDDFMVDFDPPTRFVRDDPYDNQVGEAEYEEGKAFGEHKIELLSFEEV